MHALPPVFPPAAPLAAMTAIASHLPRIARTARLRRPLWLRAQPHAPATPNMQPHVQPRLSAAAAAFVLIALAALAASPLLTFRRLEALRGVSAATTVAAAPDLSDVRRLFAEEVILHELLRIGADPTAAPRYFAVRAREDVALARLERLAPRIGPAVPGRVAALRRLATRWHGATDARARGQTSEQAFVASLPEVRAWEDSTLDAHARLAAEVERVEAHYHRVGARAVHDQQRLSAALGLLAAAAAAAVAWAARRERRLTLALAAAVDEEHRLRAEAERRREELLRVGESRARLVRGFTHDVKNPLGAADGYLALLEEGIPDPATGAQRRSLARARGSLRAALHLIGDLLEVARAESGAIAVQAVPTDLAAVACDAAEEYRAQAEAKGLRLRVALDAPVPLVPSDPVRVRQVLGNLIANAVKYTPHGDVTVRVLGAREEGAGDPACRYAIEVTDTGPGIAPEHQGRLFEEFVRLAPEVAPGAGIGLAISHRIARALGGDLAVRSAPGQGSTFVLWLPARCGA